MFFGHLKCVFGTFSGRQTIICLAANELSGAKSVQPQGNNPCHYAQQTNVLHRPDRFLVST